ncbi:tyrosine-type recombinase/integrase [Pseudomonas fluorescens]|uniref:Tyrosine-type recombinase/integrase n=1 Tax=Pseudomonas fluorescens TaxID=294 RepID=A0A944DF10_PSEFL|nr:integrase arm-type DNA-binding domain-containing protein [Pseudomonas fluorescens]MBT2298234.1 tyrosine-type recombinase/integrase [Pseudomonas fluorescens]MBT2309643.1 tyrosine-type recombinase/integrase [Pseudomonas fluorescens]MBT2314806.1 tyrosine-type recombinase/integrase [Pseudomonas fluorescens]MBT2327712.1 tyrosine-type recombinase/integrase [Pseudomonas fluorescens]MBT2345459.1 tyrosine-type recombinase/integrase [Pseudomonas fluorescens]
MALSDTTVRQARITGNDYTMGDTDGLALNVTARGGKIWRFRYYWAGVQKRMSLGSYPQISLKEARARRDGARALVAQGINPYEYRKQQRRAVRFAAEHTFEAVFNQWVEFRRLSLKEGRQSTLSQILRIFNKDVLPTLGGRSIYDINRHDLLDLLSRIEQRKALTTAEKCRTWFNQLFRYALVKIEGLEHNPASDLDVVALPKPPVTHNPFLRMDELPALMAALRNYGGANQTRLGLRLLLLTGVRTGELRLATPDQFDLEKRLWVIPAEVVKQLQLAMRKPGKQTQNVPPYIVPLSVQALEIVRYLLEQVVPAQRYLFAHRSDLSKRISENTLNGALRRMGYADQLTGHGMRATISTALNEIGYPKVWVDAQLSHADPDKVSAAYNHAEYVEQRRTMMQDWANRLDLWGQGQLKAASSPLTIRLEGAASLPSLESANTNAVLYSGFPATTVPASRTSVSNEPVLNAAAVLPAPTQTEQLRDPQVSDIQRQRAEMLATYEASSNLPLLVFAKLAGKSRDQINRDIKARRLLSLSLGNRGQRIPDWQLDPLRHKLVLAALAQFPDVDAWRLYGALCKPHERLKGRAPIDVLNMANFDGTARIVCSALSSS